MTTAIPRREASRLENWCYHSGYRRRLWLRRLLYCEHDYQETGRDRTHWTGGRKDSMTGFPYYDYVHYRCKKCGATVCSDFDIDEWSYGGDQGPTPSAWRRWLVGLFVKTGQKGVENQ